MFKVRSALLVATAILFTAPFAFLAVLSLGQGWRFPLILPAHLGLENWGTVFSSQNELGESLVLSIFISLIVASIVTVLGFLTSRAIAYHRNGMCLLFLAYLPYFFSPVIYAACLYFFFVKAGLAGTLFGVILGQLIIAYPFSIIFFSGAWSRQLRSYEELVNTLGGTSTQALLRVLVPVSRGLLLVCFLQTFLISWFEYGLTGILGVGRIQTLTVRVYQYMNEANDSYAALAGCLLTFPPLILLWLNKRFVLKVVK